MSSAPVLEWIAAAPAIRYADLPVTHQKALAQALALDTARWARHGDPAAYGFREEPSESPYWTDHHGAARYWAAHLAGYVAEHPDHRFAALELPADVLHAAIMALPGIGHPTWETYHAWYVSTPDFRVPDEARGVPPFSREVWPVILDDVRGGVLSDGWHRLHDYADRGIDPIPAVGVLPLGWFAPWDDDD